jgi:hypothetical protein
LIEKPKKPGKATKPPKKIPEVYLLTRRITGLQEKSRASASPDFYAAMLIMSL